MWTDQLVFEGGGVAFFCSAGNLENDTFAGISKNVDYSPQCVVPEGISDIQAINCFSTA